MLVLPCLLSLAVAGQAANTTYDEPTAILLARLAGAAYNATAGGHEACLASPFMGLSAAVNASSFRKYDDGEFLVFSVVENYHHHRVGAESEVRMYIACRGTSNTEQLLKDMTSVVATPFLEGTRAASRAALYFHTAAMAHYSAIAAEVARQQAAVRAAFPPGGSAGPGGGAAPAAARNLRLYLTGHSLGGAMASLIALQLVALNVSGAVAAGPSSRAPVLYTFGAPRCGDWEFAQALNEAVPESFRVVYRADPVPHTPQCRTAAPNGGSGNDASVLNLLGACTRASTDVLMDPIWAFHHGTEVWYPGHGLLGTGTGMPDIKNDVREAGDHHPLPKICIGAPFGEDRECSNSMSNTLGGSLNALDHLRYFTPENEVQKISQVCANVALKATLFQAVARHALSLLLAVPLSIGIFLCLVCSIKKRVKLRREERASATAVAESGGAGQVTSTRKKVLV